MWDFSCVSLEISILLFFFPFYFLVIVVLLFLVLFVLFLVAVISLFSFLCSFRVVVLMYRCYFQCWRILFLLLFLTHIACLCHLLVVRLYASSIVFLFSSPFVEVLPCQLQKCSRVSYKGCSPGVYPFVLLMRFLQYCLVLGSFLVLLLFDGVRSQYSQLLVLLLLLLLLLLFHTSALADGLTLEIEWQVSRILLSNLADLNNAVVWMVSTRPLIFKSSVLLPNLWWQYQEQQFQLV